MFIRLTRRCKQDLASYALKGDYSDKAGSPALTIGFKNFPMDSFGVMQVVPTPVNHQQMMKRISSMGGTNFLFHYASGRSMTVPDADFGTGFAAIIYDLLGKKIATMSLEKKEEFTVPALTTKTHELFIISIEKEMNGKILKVN